MQSGGKAGAPATFAGHGTGPRSRLQTEEDAAVAAACPRLRAPGIPLEYASPEEQAFRKAASQRLPMSAS